MISNFNKFPTKTGRKPAPSFAYEVVYGKPPEKNRRGRYPGKVEEKSWKGIRVDKHLKDKWLNDLNKIKNIEMRSSCEGHDEEWVTYVIFRLEPYLETKENVEKLCQTLINDHLLCDYEVGQENRLRIVCAAPLWYNCPNQQEWEKWWNDIAKKIDKAVKQID